MSLPSALGIALSFLFLVSCTPQARIEAMRAEELQRNLSTVAYAAKHDSPARGARTCLVDQVMRAYRTQKKQSLQGSEGAIYSTVSGLYARVFPDGTVGLAVSEKTYPQSTVYFLLDGMRYQAREDRHAVLDNAGLDALKRDALVQYSWTSWPYNASLDSEDILAGFEAAYNECLTFLRT